MNAHIAIGGDLLIATVDGILPTSGAITKSRAELELAAITRNIRPMWREEVLDKREHHWTMCKWDEYGGMFVSAARRQSRQVQAAWSVNAATGAWTRFTGWDAMCFIQHARRYVFRHADRPHHAGRPHRLRRRHALYRDAGRRLGNVFRRRRRPSPGGRRGPRFRRGLASRSSRNCRPLSIMSSRCRRRRQPGPIPACWISGIRGCGTTRCGMPAAAPEPVVRNTGWVSIGMTGYTHAPIVQVTVAQQAKPEVDLISIAATFERAGINV